jgi:mRNA-degrading endonuclease RelE of RelBE toxin-antitoxin system
MEYLIEYADSVGDQLRALTARQRVIILTAIGEQLLHEPIVETRNRKPLRPNPIAPWELRVDRFRVFYDVDASGEAPVVRVLAVGEKEGNTLRIAGKEVEL